MLVTFMKLGKVNSGKNHIQLVNKNKNYEKKKKKLNQETAKNWTIVKKTAYFKEMVN
jgi:hypothetical protein